jgi:hypothetical protein
MGAHLHFPLVSIREVLYDMRDSLNLESSTLSPRIGHASAHQDVRDGLEAFHSTLGDGIANTDLGLLTVTNHDIEAHSKRIGSEH